MDGDFWCRGSWVNIVFVSVIKKDDLKNVFKALILSGFVVSIISLIYLIQGNLNFQGRLQGIYDSPNFLAMYLAVPLILSLWLSLRILLKNCPPKDTGRRPSEAPPSVSASPLTMRLGLRRVFLVSSFLLLGIVLFFTKSFGAWMGVLGALIFGLILYLYKKPAQGWSASGRKTIALALIFAAFAIIFILGLVKINSLEGLRSFDARFIIWQKAWQTFNQYPLIGIGPGTFQDYFPLYPKWGVPQPHNLFLAFLLQAGIIGFIGFIWLILYFFKKNFKLLTTQYSLLIVVIMSYILIHGLVDTTYWKNDLSLIFWLIIGTMAVIKKEP